MLRCRFLFPLFAAVVFCCSAFGQEAPPQQAAPKIDREKGNLELPKRAPENWSSPSDVKTGLDPVPSEVVSKEEHPDFDRQMIRMQWRFNDPIEVWVVRPKKNAKVDDKAPVIVYLYGSPDKGDQFRDNGWCKRATSDGFAAVGFVAALTDYRFKERPLKQWFVSELAESLGSTAHDVILVLNELQQGGYLDTRRVGAFGIGAGGTIALLVAQADPRIASVDVLDPWADWPEWLKDTPLLTDQDRPKFLTQEFLKSVSTLDPLTYLPSLKTPSVRIQQNWSDPVTPTKVKQALASAAPPSVTVVKYENAADLMKSWQAAGLSGWLKQQMRLQRPNDANGDGHVAKK